MPRTENAATAVRIYGLWRDHGSTIVPGYPSSTLVHYYDSPIALWEPLVIGRRVQLIALSPVPYRTLTPSLHSNAYDVYDPQIVGRVAGVHIRNDGVIVCAVENERAVSAVGLVVITLPFNAGLSRLTREGDCPEGWMKKLLLQVRNHVVAQVSVMVHDNLGHGETPVPVLQYPDPRIA